MRHHEIVSERMSRHIGCWKNSIRSRQRDRAEARRDAFEEITAQYGGEPRKLRRLFARLRVQHGAVQSQSVGEGPSGSRGV
jgi:hypothetical protein